MSKSRFAKPDPAKLDPAKPGPAKPGVAEPGVERISEAEHAVMEVLWDHAPLSAAQVCDIVCERRDWSVATVKTLLSRLVTKGALATKPDGRRFLYRPTFERVSYVGGESRRLVNRLFGGRASSLFAHLAETEALTEDDLAEIETLMKELRK